jgi:hypothetical protein
MAEEEEEYDGTFPLDEDEKTEFNKDGFFYPNEKQMKRYKYLFSTSLELYPGLDEFRGQLLCMEQIMLENGMFPTTEEVQNVADSYYKSNIYEGISVL